MNAESQEFEAGSFTAKIKFGEGEADRDIWLPFGSPSCGFSRLIKVHIEARGDLFSIGLCCPGLVLSYRGMMGGGGSLFSSPPPSHFPG